MITYIALAIGAYLLYRNSQLEKTIKSNESNIDDLRQDLNWYEDQADDIITKDKVNAAVKPVYCMCGFSSISDVYWNCAAGVVWENTSNEAINIRLDSAKFIFAGYEMNVGATDLTTIKVPANGKIYQPLFSYENQKVFNTQAERTQVRELIGSAQGHPGKEAKAIWGRAWFDGEFRCTYSVVSDFSKVDGGTVAIRETAAKGRYFGSAALVRELISWVREHCVAEIK